MPSRTTSPKNPPPAERWRTVEWRALDKEVTMRIKTRCPEKWLLVDRETGQCWRWEGEWRRA